MDVLDSMGTTGPASTTSRSGIPVYSGTPAPSSPSTSPGPGAAGSHPCPPADMVQGLCKRVQASLPSPGWAVPSQSRLRGRSQRLRAICPVPPPRSESPPDFPARPASSAAHPWGPPWPPAPLVPGAELGAVGNAAGMAGSPGCPHSSAWLSFSLTGLQRAPCGCFFNPQLFSMQWTMPNLPPAGTSTLGFGAAASLPGAALLGPGGCRTLPAWAAPGTPQGPAQHLVPQNHQGTGAMAPALPQPNPGNKHIEGVPAGNNISSMNTSMGIAPGNNIPPGSNILLDPSSDHLNQRLVESDGDIEVTEEMLLKEALRLFGMSEEMEAVIQHSSSSITMTEDHGNTIRKGKTLAPAATDLLNSIPSNKNIEGVSAEPNIPSTATSVGTTLGFNIPPAGDVPPSPSSDPHHQGFGDLNDSLAHYEEMPLEEALRFFSCYEDTEGVIQEGPSSSCMPEDPGGADIDIPLYDFTSLSLPDELLTCDYDVNEIAKVIQSLEDINTGKYTHEPWADAGMDLESSKPDGAE